MKVGTAPEMEHRLTRAIHARRKQYGIRPRIAMTIHKAMGGDFGSVVSCVGASNDGYKLWQKEQVEVLISRTHGIGDLTFVGNTPQATADHLTDLLFKQSPFSAYMKHVVQQMTGNNPGGSVVHPLRYLPYNVKNVVIPTDSNGFVYLLMSLRDHNTTYIGQTRNLSRRIQEHNSGLGSFVTANPLLRPWHVIGFVTGFERDDKCERMQFEGSWQAQRNARGKYSLNPLDVLHIGKELVETKNEHSYLQYNLKFVQCIEFHYGASAHI